MLTAIAESNSQQTTFRLLDDGRDVGTLTVSGPLKGTIVVRSEKYRVRPPANQAERVAAYTAASISPDREKDKGSPVKKSVWIVMHDEFERLLAVACKRSNTWELHWDDNNCHFKRFPIQALRARWTLTALTNGKNWGRVGRKSIFEDEIAFSTTESFSEPLKAFIVWLAASHALEI